MELLDRIIQEAAQFNTLEWSATLIGIVYILLAAANRPSCWIFGMVSCALWAYASYAYYLLYLDAILQVFYVAISVWGLYQWMRGTAEQTPLPIRELGSVQHLILIGGGLLLSLLFGYTFDQFTPAASTYWDAVTTVFSIITTFLLVQRIKSNWLYWLVVDAIYVFLYASRGAYLFSGLMVLYLVIATLAYFRWRKEWRMAA